jgi:uncharacterized protein (DUF2336 family)
MSIDTSRFARLKDLAGADSSEQRRDLMREITSAFFDDGETRTQAEGILLDDVLGMITKDMTTEVRKELSERVAKAGNAPRELARRMAFDEIEVAAPVLRSSKALTQEDLVEIVSSRTQAHIQAVTTRPDISESVSEAIVDHGDDTAVASLLKNESAAISRSSFEKVAVRAQTSPALHEPVVKRKSMPLDLLNDMYFVVEKELRASILETNAGIDPRELEHILEKSRIRVAQNMGALPVDYEEAELLIRQKKLRKELNGSALVAMMRDNKHTAFMIGLADMTGVDFDTIRRIVTAKDLDGLATICRASDLERPLFVTLCVLLGGGERAMGQAEAYGRMYLDIPVDAARRAMRFWRVRKTTTKTAAA